MAHERVTASRKTPRDGRLEISAAAAASMEQLGPALVVELDETVAEAAVDRMTCTCRGPDNQHVHYFIRSEPLATLAPGSQVDLDINASRARLIVRRVEGGDHG